MEVDSSDHDEEEKTEKVGAKNNRSLYEIVDSDDGEEQDQDQSDADKPAESENHSEIKNLHLSWTKCLEPKATKAYTK